MLKSESAIAISGEATAMNAERSARFSSTNGMLCLLLGRLPGVGAAHQQSELLTRRLRRVERRRQPAVEHHRNAVGDLGEFVEILADDQHRGAACGEIDQR